VAPGDTHFVVYAFCVGLSIIVGIFVLRRLRYSKEDNDIRLMSLLPIIVAGAILGTKVPVILSYGWQKEFLWTGKSYFGALLGAFLALNAYKRFTGKSGKFGDRFVVPLCISAGIGKIGCFLNGCCGGIPTHTIFGVINHQGVMTYPVQLFESVFEFVCSGFFFILYRRKKFPGAHFSLYMLLYMSFRFTIEFIRLEPDYMFGLSIYQWMAIVFFPVFFSIFLRRISSAR